MASTQAFLRNSDVEFLSLQQKCNLPFKSASVPEDWKAAIATPIFKKGRTFGRIFGENQEITAWPMGSPLLTVTFACTGILCWLSSVANVL